MKTVMLTYTETVRNILEQIFDQFQVKMVKIMEPVPINIMSNESDRTKIIIKNNLQIIFHILKMRFTNFWRKEKGIQRKVILPNRDAVLLVTPVVEVLNNERIYIQDRDILDTGLQTILIIRKLNYSAFK